MRFVNPWMLAGVVLAVVPIVLHLVMRPQPRRLEFPALRLVRRQQHSNQRRMRLRHLLLLASRVAVIALLAGAMARPSIRPGGASGEADGPVAAAFVFDTAMHMQYRHENRTRLEVAREMGLWVLEQLPVESQVAVIETAPSAAVFQIDLGAAADRMERLEPSAVAGTIDRALIDAAALLERSDRPRKEIYVFSDLAQSTWLGGASQRVRQRLERLNGPGVYVVDVGVERPGNVSLGLPELPTDTLGEGASLQVEVNVRTRGRGVSRGVELLLSSDDTGALEKRGQQSIDVGADDSRVVRFSVSGLSAGVHQGEIRLQGGDGLAADDVRFFTVQIQPPQRVLIAAPSPADDHAFLFREAIAPEAFRKSGRARFECDVVDYKRLDATRLDGYRVVCLLDPTPLAERMWSRLSGYVARGGAVAVFLGRHATPIRRFNDAVAQELLPAPLDRQARRPDGDVYLRISRPEHPLWTRFRPLLDRVPWSQFPIFRYWQLGPLNEGAVVLATYSDGAAALVERSVGRGRVLLMTTSVSDVDPQRQPWNLLPTGFQPWPFVMLANETMLYLSGSRDVRRNYVAGQTVVIPIAEDHHWSTYVLSAPGGQSYRRTFDRGQSRIVISATETPGNYRVRAGGVSEGIDQGFGVNLAEEATELKRTGRETLDALFGEGGYSLVRRRDEMQRSVARGRVGHELYGPLLLVLIVVLAGEHVLANRFYRDSVSHDSGTAAVFRHGGESPQQQAGATVGRRGVSEAGGLESEAVVESADDARVSTYS